ncbi:MAG: polysaccharide deacetylase family protein [Treponema sp.]|nr:polysaccharide deacetylase family protein [Treponema sp.]
MGVLTTLAGCASNQPYPPAYPVPDKVIAFTIDDGPSTKTDRLLEVLEEQHIKATCFLIGRNIRQYPAAAVRIFEAGHEIGNHSDSWEGLGGKDEKAISASLEAASAEIVNITGSSPVYFRAPNLDYGPGVLASVAGDMGMSLTGTDVIAMDWEAAITTDGIIDNVINSAKDGGIILIHERHEGDLERTIRAIPVIADKLRQAGYEIVTVTELAAKKDVVLEPGVTYTVIR